MAGQFPGAQGFLGNPLLAALPPDQQQNLLQLQQRQAIGQALLQQGLQPLDTSNRQVGGMGYRISPLEGVSKLLNTYVGNKMSMDAMGQEGQLMSQMAGGAYGTDSTAPAVQQQPPVTGAADSGALTGLSAGMGSYAPQPNPRAVGQAMLQNNPNTPMATSTTPGPLTLPGRTAAQSRTLAMFAPQAYAAALGASLTPTDTMKTLQAAGVQPGSPQWNEALSNVAFKDGYVAPTSVRPGGYVRDAHTGQMTWAPQVPQGAVPQFDNNGQFTGVAPMPGAADVEQGQSAAAAAGKAQYTIVPGVQGGRPVNTTAYNLANGLPPPGQPQATGGGVNAGRFGSYQPPNNEPVAPSLPAGAGSLAEGAADRIKALSAQAANTPNVIDAYNKAETSLLSGVTTGPGSTLGTNIIGKLNTAGIPLEKGDATGYQSLQKYLSNANAQAASAGGYNGSDARFEAFSHGQPSAEAMNPDALRYAIQYVRGQQWGVAAKNQATTAFLAQQGGGTANYPQFEAQWNKVYSPDVALIKAMPNPADQQNYLTQLKQQGKLGAWMKSYQQMQQMGAF
ncbi:hypothetical protein [Paraburkholderia sediminicola]|uniref:hypothetical protein n=1 Tax=Paraburkholderia sediminicola TaxID=458836 RepID=UPI0038B9D5AB